MMLYKIEFFYYECLLFLKQTVEKTWFWCQKTYDIYNSYTTKSPTYGNKNEIAGCVEKHLFFYILKS